MKTSLRLLAAPIILWFGLSASAVEPRYYGASVGALAEAKSRLSAGDPALRPAYDQLLAEADQALRVKPPSVMDKAKPGASGDKHDYMSTAPYWWPDPAKPDGLPYIRRDGAVNPDSRTAASDQGRLSSLGKHVDTLALAWPETDETALTAWCGQFLDWMRSSPFGTRVSASDNNQATMADVRAVRPALKVGRIELARDILREVGPRRIAVQIAPDGSRPRLCHLTSATHARSGQTVARRANQDAAMNTTSP